MKEVKTLKKLKRYCKHLLNKSKSCYEDYGDSLSFGKILVYEDIILKIDELITEQKQVSDEFR